MEKIVFQHAYSASFRASDIECKDPSLTQQHCAEDCDINVIVERYKVTGQLPSSPVVYGDFTQVGDFRQAMDSLRAAQAAFMSIDPKIRMQFGNDPGAFSEFCMNKENLPKLREWGLAPTPDVPRETSDSDKKP